MTANVFWFFAALIASQALIFATRKFAILQDIIDIPDSERRFHNKPTAKLGGIAIYLTIAIIVAYLVLTGDNLTSGEISTKHYWGFLIGGFVLMIGGFLDDKYHLPPRITFIFPAIAALIAVLSGIEVDKITNPLGGILEIKDWISNVIIFIWLLCLMYTTKFLDGLDGLATGVSSIAVFMILLLTLSVKYFQPDVALLSSLSLGALMGFLIWNFHPAKIFLGEGGSTFVGYLVGVLSVISGSKLATALLVMAVPAFDVAWVIYQRLKKSGLKQVARGDRRHLHHRLFGLGLGQRRVVLIYYSIAFIFGLTTLFLQSSAKFALIGALFAFCAIIGFVFLKADERRDKNSK